jgi:polysaccharide export outer membrane protein
MDSKNTALVFRCVVLAVLLSWPWHRTSAQSTNYVVGPQDVLIVTLWDQPDLSGKFTVQGDGTFTFPMIGQVKAAGLTLPQVEAGLKERLSPAYFKNPQLNVAVEQYRSQRIFIVGEVRQPGAYPLSGNMTLIEALAQAGSTSADAAGHAVIVHRPLDGAHTAPTIRIGEANTDVVRVELKELETGALANNLQLRDGDTIFVPRAETAYIFGQVRSPGGYVINKATTVLQALSLAGGVTDRGSTTRVRVIRVVDGAKKEIKVRLSDLVQAGDTIMVPERFF